MADKKFFFKIQHPEKIQKNQLNKSVSKQQYSFTRAERFRNKTQTDNYHFYDLPSPNKNKANSIGKSQRTTFLIKNKNPSPNSYQTQTSFSNHGISFPCGRQKAISSSFLKINKNPGPGQYTPNQQLTKKLASMFTIRKKVIPPKPDQDAFPGPGKYDVKYGLLNDQRVLSNEKRSYCPIFSSPTNTKVLVDKKYPKMNNPVINHKGEKTFKVGKGYTVGKQKRFHLRIKTEGPGPGQYNQFSQFLH